MNRATRNDVLQDIEDTTKDGHFPNLLWEEHLLVDVTTIFVLFQDDTHLVDTPAHEEDKEIEGQSEHDTCSLKGPERLITTRNKESRCNCAFGEGPEDTLEPMVFFGSVASKSVDDQGPRIRGRNEVNRKCEDRQPAHKLPEPRN